MPKKVSVKSFIVTNKLDINKPKDRRKIEELVFLFFIANINTEYTDVDYYCAIRNSYSCIRSLVTWKTCEILSSDNYMVIKEFIRKKDKMYSDIYSKFIKDAPITKLRGPLVIYKRPSVFSCNYKHERYADVFKNRHNIIVK